MTFRADLPYSVYPRDGGNSGQSCGKNEVFPWRCPMLGWFQHEFCVICFMQSAWVNQLETWEHKRGCLLLQLEPGRMYLCPWEACGFDGPDSGITARCWNPTVSPQTQSDAIKCPDRKQKTKQNEFLQVQNRASSVRKDPGFLHNAAGRIFCVSRLVKAPRRITQTTHHRSVHGEAAETGRQD